MTDADMKLVERLNRLAKRRDMEGIYTDGNICEEAAATIERLREALESIAYDRLNEGEPQAIARKALTGE